VSDIANQMEQERDAYNEAMDEARETGYRQGLEAALLVAKHWEERADQRGLSGGYTADRIAHYIKELLTNYRPAELVKPEECPRCKSVDAAIKFDRANAKAQKERDSK
jgi:flagellar biosynthesis/type III secretory pathway protein FliH